MILRGYRGTMVAPSTLDDESYLDAVQALRGLAMGPLSDRARADAAALGEQPPADIAADPARSRIAALPAVGIRDRLLRSSQEMLWRRTAQSYDRNREGLLAELAGPGPDDQALDNPAQPGYLREHHLQAGGTHGDELAGFVYHYGTKVFWLGTNDRDQGKEAIVAALPLPADGTVHRALELACSAGQSTTALKARFPDAEVWGTDVAAPQVRYARWRARRLRSDVHFRQLAAEDLDFADASFDLVYASLLFHEVPVPVGQQIARQVARVLRPGGVFIVNDLNPRELTDGAWPAYERWWDTTQNAEPYELEFLRSDFTAALERSFSRVEFAAQGYSGRWTAYR
jgi:ubiquinone/menaquinone biosynthesis C-methylase UbiE